MSETATTDQEQKPAAPEALKEAPFTVDVLLSCTSRFTRKAWDLLLAYQSDLNKIKTAPIRFTLTARDAAGAQAMAKTLKDQGGVAELTVKDKTIEGTATFAAIQLVIKQPEATHFDAIALD